MTSPEIRSIWEELDLQHRELDERFSNLFKQNEEDLEELFKRRAEALASPPQGQRMEGDIYLVSLAGEEFYGFSVQQVARIVVPGEYVPIPHGDTTFLGVINHMNEALPVLSLLNLLRLERSDNRMKIVIILEHEGRFVGCEVEAIREIATIENLESTKTSKKHPVLKYIISYEDSVLGIVDVPTLFSVISQSAREE